MTALCFVDTETDGVHPDRKVWEVAMIRRDDDGEIRRRFFVEIDLSTADPFGLKVGGFYDRHPLGKAIAGTDLRVESQHAQTDAVGVKSEMDAALEVARFTHGAHLVGAVPNFDAEVLAGLLRDNDLTPSWHHHLIDVEAMAVGYLHGNRPHHIRDGTGDPIDWPEGFELTLPWKSDSLSGACGVEPPTDDERHTAMGDAEWAMRWYDAMTGGEQQ